MPGLRYFSLLVTKTFPMEILCERLQLLLSVLSSAWHIDSTKKDKAGVKTNCPAVWSCVWCWQAPSCYHCHCLGIWGCCCAGWGTLTEVFFVARFELWKSWETGRCLWMWKPGRYRRVLAVRSGCSPGFSYCSLQSAGGSGCGAASAEWRKGHLTEPFLIP